MVLVEVTKCAKFRPTESLKLKKGNGLNAALYTLRSSIVNLYIHRSMLFCVTGWAGKIKKREWKTFAVYIKVINVIYVHIITF